MKYVYVPMVDSDMTMRSKPEPMMSCLSNKEEAEKFMEGKSSMQYAYLELPVFDTIEEVQQYEREYWRKKYART